MNISKEDITFLEKKYGEAPAKGKVWELAKEGKTLQEIEDALIRLAWVTFCSQSD